MFSLALEFYVYVDWYSQNQGQSVCFGFFYTCKLRFVVQLLCIDREKKFWLVRLDGAPVFLFLTWNYVCNGIHSQTCIGVNVVFLDSLHAYTYIRIIVVSVPEPVMFVYASHWPTWLGIYNNIATCWLGMHFTELNSGFLWFYEDKKFFKTSVFKNNILHVDLALSYPHTVVPMPIVSCSSLFITLDHIYYKKSGNVHLWFQGGLWCFWLNSPLSLFKAGVVIRTTKQTGASLVCCCFHIQQ